MKSILRFFVWCSAIATFCLSLSAAASAAIIITSAKMSAGKLVVTGTSSTGSQIKLDNGYTAAINAVSHAFSFNLAYKPVTCIVRLAVVSSTVAMNAAVADCGPQGSPFAGQILRTTSVSAPVTLSMDWQFIGTPVRETITATQSLVAAPVGSASFDVTEVSMMPNGAGVYLCYRPAATPAAIPTLFGTVPASMQGQGFYGTPITISASNVSATLKPGAGTYDVGLCVKMALSSPPVDLTTASFGTLLSVAD